MAEHPTLKIKGSKSQSLTGKRIVLGVTGSIAAVKCVELARELIRHGAEVLPVLSKEARRIIHPNSMHYACGREPITKLSGAIEHVRECGVGGMADLLLIAPATANTVGKIVQGIDDTPVTTFATTALGRKMKLVLVPAMHSSMYESPAVQRNLEQAGKDTIIIVNPKKEENKAKFPEIEDIVIECERALGNGKFAGKKIVVSSGATLEEIDDVRVLTNKSSGKTGQEIAKEFYRRGAEVTIVHNSGALVSGIGARKVETAEQMENALLEECKKADIFVSVAAMGDFGVKKEKGKIKSEEEKTLTLKPRSKTIAKIREKFPELFVVGFKAESVGGKELESRAHKFLDKNNLQAVCANNISKHKIGGQENEVLLISKNKLAKAKGLKEKISRNIVDFIEDVYFG